MPWRKGTDNAIRVAIKVVAFQVKGCMMAWWHDGKEAGVKMESLSAKGWLITSLGNWRVLVLLCEKVGPESIRVVTGVGWRWASGRAERLTSGSICSAVGSSWGIWAEEGNGQGAVKVFSKAPGIHWTSSGSPSWLIWEIHTWWSQILLWIEIGV